MGEKIKMEVKIRGKYYTIISDEPEEYIFKICARVDRKVSEICKINPRLGTEMSSILTAINMTDEMCKAQAKTHELEVKVRELEEKLRRAGIR